jgi:hypothetical protein
MQAAYAYPDKAGGWRVAWTQSPKTNLGGPYAGFACGAYFPAFSLPVTIPPFRSSAALTLPPIFHFHFPVFSLLLPYLSRAERGIPFSFNHFQLFLDVCVPAGTKKSPLPGISIQFTLSEARSLLSWNQECLTTLLQSTASALFFKTAGWHTQPLSLGASK